jgi:hypothetical protein
MLLRHLNLGISVTPHPIAALLKSNPEKPEVSKEIRKPRNVSLEEPSARPIGIYKKRILCMRIKIKARFGISIIWAHCELRKTIDKSTKLLCLMIFSAVCISCVSKPEGIFDEFVNAKTTRESERLINDAFRNSNCEEQFLIARRSGFHKVDVVHRNIWQYEVQSRFLFTETVTTRIQFEQFPDSKKCKFFVFQEGL